MRKALHRRCFRLRAWRLCHRRFRPLSVMDGRLFRGRCGSACSNSAPACFAPPLEMVAVLSWTLLPTPLLLDPSQPPPDTVIQGQSLQCTPERELFSCKTVFWGAPAPEPPGGPWWLLVPLRELVHKPWRLRLLRPCVEKGAKNWLHLSLKYPP